MHDDDGQRSACRTLRMTRPATQYITPTLIVGLFLYATRAISSSYLEGDVLHLLKAREAYKVFSTIFSQPGMRSLNGNLWAARSVLNEMVTFFGDG